jgi:hypothetical protein
MQRLLLMGVAFFTVPFVFAQRTTEISYTIDWTDQRSVPPPPVGVIGFEGAWWDDELPIALYDQKLDVRASRAEFIVSDVRSERVTAQQLTQRQLALLPEQLVVEPRIADGRNTSYAQLRIVPIWRDAATGEVRRLLALEGTLRVTPGLKTTSRTIDWAPTSVLAEGEWYKIAVARDGIYRINRSFLASLGIDVASVNPQTLNIYGNGGGLLPFDNSAPRADDLLKNAIHVTGEADGSFDDNDAIVFYAKGPDTWRFDSELDRFTHQKHFYSDSAYYFLRVNDPSGPKRIESQGAVGAHNQETAVFSDRQFIENELVNLAKSGRTFFGERFSNPQPIPYVFQTPNRVSGLVTIDARVAARSVGTVGSSFTLSSNGEQLVLSPSPTTGSVTANIANLSAGTLVTSAPAGATLQLNLQFAAATADAEGWLDFLRVNYRREIRSTGVPLFFRDPATVGPGNVTRFLCSNLGNSIAGVEVWDVTDPTEPVRMNLTALSGPDFYFDAPTAELREFVMLGQSGLLEPARAGRVANQNLHGFGNIDMVVLSNVRYLGIAEQFKELHAQQGLSIEIVTPEQVYNEFSSGAADVTAIKSLMKMLYDRAGSNESQRPKYLQIIGDGTFLNRHIPSNSRYVITYQSSNSISPTNSYVSDDYFGFLEDQFGEGLGDKMAIGVGRIPCESVAEGQGYINKLRNYLSANTSLTGDAFCLGDAEQSPFGAWRNIITFVADDMDGSGGPTEVVHMINSDEHANRVFEEYNDFDVVKIYMDAYQQVSTPGGQRYPEVEEAIRRRVQNGALIVNYIGHGGERGWAHERVLNINTIQGWSNFNRLPVFVTATCELARFDDPEFKSAGELLILNPNGGAIAMLTTTRIVFSGSNQQLNRAFFRVALEHRNIENLSLGFIAMETKNDPQVNDSSNKRNFSLLGSVAMQMAYPKMRVFTTEVNGMAVNAEEPDTVRSLQLVTIKGYVGDDAGNQLTGFNGFVYPTVYDKKSQVTTLNNDNAPSPHQFNVWRNTIYRGKSSVSNGDFSFSFIVPRDIDFEFGNGRVSYYAVDGDLDGHGHFEDFIIGGVLDGAALSDVPPDVGVFMNDTTFVFGGITNESPLLLARISAENGVNTTGAGIGHDLRAVLDGNTNDPIILNDFYEADLDTYQSGSIRYQLAELSEGLHNVSVKVWDVHNNSAESFTEFVVAGSAEMALAYVLNYPNPFTTRTQFMFEHNQPCEYLDVQIQVFTVSGKMVKSINRTVRSEGFRGEPIEWDGLDDFGDVIAKGVYVYRMKVLTPDGLSAERFEKLVILR